MIEKHLARSEHFTIDALELLHLCHQPISTIDIDETEWPCSMHKHQFLTECANPSQL